MNIAPKVVDAADQRHTYVNAKLLAERNAARHEADVAWKKLQTRESIAYFLAGFGVALFLVFLSIAFGVGK